MRRISQVLISRVTGQVLSTQFHLSGYRVNQDLGNKHEK
jgi:hypothetical protein